ncbi:hypothetical protein T12_895 [Trichinella patagoniensis]|uniref:Uncharacterized protein n=1 Tax=Trichinella patagoniensis TaxID=990121 RepID=A0A0V0XSR6_9BILA|nr:hypothetical protein T12_895 [Trichinella patagoniensis]
MRREWGTGHIEYNANSACSVILIAGNTLDSGHMERNNSIKNWDENSFILLIHLDHKFLSIWKITDIFAHEYSR